MAGQKQKLAPMWKKFDEERGSCTNQHHFLITYIWDLLNINANQMKQLLDKMRRCLNHVFLLEQLRNFGVRKPHAKTVAWSYDMEGHARKCVDKYCEPANKKTEQLYKVSSFCMDDHQVKEELESVGEISKVCSQIVLKCLYLARIGRLDILWSVNKLARTVTKWTQACAYVHHTSDFRQCCQVGNTAQHCRLGLFQDSDFAGALENSKSTSGGILCTFGSRTLVTISWMCKKQTSAFHSSTESEIFSSDAGLRIDGLLALDLWDVVIEVLRSTNKTKSPTNPAASGNGCETGNCLQNTPKPKQKGNSNCWSIVTH